MFLSNLYNHYCAFFVKLMKHNSLVMIKYYLLLLPAFLWSQNLEAVNPLKCHISATGNQLVLCQGMPLFLIINLHGNEDQFSARLWQTTGNFITSPENLFVRFDTSNPGTFLVSFTASTPEGDSAYCETKIEVLAQPNIEIVENFRHFGWFLFKKPMPRLQIIPTENYIFQWFLNGDEIPGATRARYRPRKSGRYHVKAVSQNGCSAFSKSIIVE